MRSGATPGRARRGCGAAVAQAIALLLALGAMAAPAAAVPGSPGVPQPPGTVFAEDFENGVGATPILLPAYTGATGQTYSAEAQWLVACNGSIVQAASPDSAQAASGCAGAGNYAAVRQLAYALGAHRDLTSPELNHAVTAYTEGGGPGANRVQLETESPVPLPAGGRFVTLAVDAVAVNCQSNDPLFNFFVLDGPTETPAFGAPVNPCTDPDAQIVVAPALGGSAARSTRTGTYRGDRALLLTAGELGIRMRNAQGSAAGNDAAFDNVQVLDVTPQLDKSFAQASLDVGQATTLTFTITNTDELAAKEGWSFADTLPAGVVVTGPDPSTTCSGALVDAPAGSDSIAVAGSLEAGQPSCTVTVHVSSATAGTYANCAANVTTFALDAPACAAVTFEAADVSIAKRALSPPVVPGEEASFELVASNAGPSRARSVVVTDDLPAELSFVSASPGCTHLDGTVTCAIESLDPGTSQTFQVTGRVASSLDGCLPNVARVASATPDPDMTDNEAAICASIGGRVDLSIEKTASRTALPAGGQVMYTLVVRNDGPSDATGVRISDPLPAGMTLVDARPSQGSCATAGNDVSCDLGRLPDGGSAQLLVTANASGAVGAIANRATASADQQEVDLDDNAGTAAVSVAPGPPEPPFDVTVTKTADDTRVALGQPVRYRIVVANRGPAAAPGVTLADTLSAPVGVSSVRTSAGSCTRRIPVRCSLGTIAPGTRVTVTVVARHWQLGCGQRNAVSAVGAGADAAPAGNVATVAVCASRIGLRLVKRADRRSVAAGRLISYTIRTANPTRGVARGVRTCDRLPAGLVHVSSAPRAKLRGGRWCWRPATLGPRQVRRYRITVRALPGARGRKVNRATVPASAQARAARAQSAVRVRPAVVRGGGVTG
jgi:uncharacterized repeat protein (TIGR01451 family)